MPKHRSHTRSRLKNSEGKPDKNALATATSIETGERLCASDEKVLTGGSDELFAQLHEFLRERGHAAGKSGPEALVRDFIAWRIARQVTCDPLK